MGMATGSFMWRNRRSLLHDRNMQAFSRILGENPVRIPFSPLNKVINEETSDEGYRGLRKYRGVNFSKKRQIFVRSYHFKRNRTIVERFRVSFRMVKVVVWRVMSLRYWNCLVSKLKRFKRLKTRSVGCCYGWRSVRLQELSLYVGWPSVCALPICVELESCRFRAMAAEVDGFPNGWPLGLETVNIRVRIMESIRSAELNSFHLATPSFSSLSSSDLDAESTRSFFPDKSITLGTLIGIRPDHTTMYNGSSGHPQVQMQMSQIRCGSTRSKSCRSLRKWKSYMGCMHSRSRTDDSIPSLGHFLEAQRQAGVSFIGASGNENIYVNVMSEEPEVVASNGDPFFLDRRNLPSRANSSRLPASELPVIEENSAGDLTDCSPSGVVGVKSKHRRAHSYNFCLPKVSNILVRMSPGRCSPSGKINHL